MLGVVPSQYDEAEAGGVTGPASRRAVADVTAARAATRDFLMMLPFSPRAGHTCFAVSPRSWEGVVFRAGGRPHPGPSPLRARSALVRTPTSILRRARPRRIRWAGRSYGAYAPRSANQSRASGWSRARGPGFGSW
ncbi:hypothetical protein GCM10019017_05200 [Streptomyces showdoensis]